MSDPLWPNLELPQPQPAPASDATDEDADIEPRLSPRERAAERAYRAAVFGMVFPPLLVYAGAVLLRVGAARGRLQGAPRRHAQLATAIVLALPVLIAICVIGAIMLPPERGPDLREYPHPRALVGRWTGTVQDPNGETRIDMQLRGDASMRYQESGAHEIDCRGWWAYAELRLFLQPTRATKGARDWVGHIRGWDAHMPNNDELVFGNCRMKRVGDR